MQEKRTEGGKHTRWRSIAWAGVRIALACLAIIALRRELNNVSAAEVIGTIENFGPTRILMALAATAGSFLIIGVFELLALQDTARYEIGLQKWIVPPKVALITSFVSNAFSQSIGLALLTGGAVRMRAYKRFHLTPGAVARISGFVTITATLGLLAGGAVALFETPSAFPTRFGLSLKLFGFALSVPAIAYVGWALLGRGTIGRNGWTMRPPTRKMAFAQVSLSVLDWLLTGSVLFIVMPASARIGYFAFLGIYLVAQTAGVVSHVPGGFGVFEGAFISLVRMSDPSLSTGALAASLVVYRVVYYLIPLAVAMVVAGIADLRAQQPVIAMRLRPGSTSELVPEPMNAA